jgi:16S rRNA (guanine(966)-N(2))-methyltransferase RsmD
MRITGGRLRSRALKAPKGSATRPTSDRVREALFSILGPRASVGRVLDLYAGTGALGLEALSRGAGHVTFVERAKEALVALNANVDALGVRGQTRVLAMPVERALRALLAEDTRRFDVVFADPPYADVASGVASELLGLAVPLLDEGGLLVLEHASRDVPASIEPTMPTGPTGTAGLVREDVRTYGDTALSFYTPRSS